VAGALSDLYASGQPILDCFRAAMNADDRQSPRVCDSIEHLTQYLHEVLAENRQFKLQNCEV
jgi:hypothetical protein